RLVTESTEASVRSAPEWQKRQAPRGPGAGFRLKKIRRPRSASVGSGAAAGFARKRSKGVSSETSVDSYSCTARPKNSEKLNSTSRYSLVSGLPSGRVTIVVVPSSATRISLAEAHHLGLKACRIKVS